MSDTFYLGTVTAKSGNLVTVTIDGNASITAVDMIGAASGCRVLVQRHGTQMLCVGFVGAVGIIESGTSNGWDYLKFSDGTIEGWASGSASFTTSLGWVETFQTPVTMQDYLVIPNHSDYRLDKFYAGDRTPTSFKIGAKGSESGTVTFKMYLRGRWQ